MAMNDPRYAALLAKRGAILKEAQKKPVRARGNQRGR